MGVVPTKVLKLFINSEKFLAFPSNLTTLSRFLLWYVLFGSTGGIIVDELPDPNGIETGVAVFDVDGVFLI